MHVEEGVEGVRGVDMEVWRRGGGQGCGGMVLWKYGRGLGKLSLTFAVPLSLSTHTFMRSPLAALATRATPTALTPAYMRAAGR